MNEKGAISMARRRRRERPRACLRRPIDDRRAGDRRAGERLRVLAIGRNFDAFRREPAPGPYHRFTDPY